MNHSFAAVAATFVSNARNRVLLTTLILATVLGLGLASSASAAITNAHLTNGGTGTDNTSFSTASVSTSADKLVLISINARTANASQPPTPTVSGLSSSWNLVASRDFDDAGSSDRASGFVFEALVSGSATGTVTMNFGAVTLDKINWSVEEFAGTAYNAASVWTDTEPIVQSATAGTTGATSLTATLASFADAANNWTFASVFRVTAEGTTPSAGMTEVSDDFTSVGTTIATQTEKATGQQLSPGGSWTTSGRAGVIAVEIKAYQTPVFPGTVGGVFPESSNAIPMIEGTEGDSDLYTVNELSAATPKPTIKKSTNGGQTWSEVDSANRPTKEDLESITLVKDSQDYDPQSGLVHMLQQQSAMTDAGDSKKHTKVYYHSFWTENGLGGTDAWQTKDELVASPYGDTATCPIAGGGGSTYVCGVFDQAVSLTQEQVSGDLVAIYNTTRDDCGVANCTGAQRIGYKTKAPGGSWSAETVLDDEASVDFTQAVSVLGDSDVTHIFYKDDTNNRVYYRTLSSTGTLSARTQINTNGTDSVDHTLIAPVRLHVGATERIVIAWKRSTGEVLNSVKIDGGVIGAQTQVSSKPVMANPDSTQSRQPVASLAADESGDKVNLVFAACTTTPCKGVAGSADPDRTVYYNTLSSGGSWGSDVQVLDNTYKTASIQATVFSNGNDDISFGNVLGLVFDQETCWDPCTPQVDNTVKYTQIAAP